jgi:hypothetical protein
MRQGKWKKDCSSEILSKITKLAVANPRGGQLVITIQF